MELLDKKFTFKSWQRSFIGLKQSVADKVQWHPLKSSRQDIATILYNQTNWRRHRTWIIIIVKAHGW
jgi:hypothetical protein